MVAWDAFRQLANVDKNKYFRRKSQIPGVLVRWPGGRRAACVLACCADSQEPGPLFGSGHLAQLQSKHCCFQF